MVKLSVCIEMIFNDMPDRDRLFAVRRAGIDAAEIWGWQHRDIDLLYRASQESGTVISAMCVGTKDEELAARYARTPLVAFDSDQVFPSVVKDSVEAAKRLGVKNLIVTVGQEQPGVTRDEQHFNIVRALKAAAGIFEDNEITAVIEPLNTLVDHRGYYLSRSGEAAEILGEVGSKYVKMLFDIYHQQITEGNVINNIERYMPLIGHFHVADNPGRHEPGTGELSYANIFKKISELGYSGYTGLEFAPTKDCFAALRDVKELNVF